MKKKVYMIVGLLLLLVFAGLVISYFNNDKYVLVKFNETVSPVDAKTFTQDLGYRYKELPRESVIYMVSTSEEHAKRIIDAATNYSDLIEANYEMSDVYYLSNEEGTIYYYDIILKLPANLSQREQYAYAEQVIDDIFDSNTTLDLFMKPQILTDELSAYILPSYLTRMWPFTCEILERYAFVDRCLYPYLEE